MGRRILLIVLGIVIASAIATGGFGHIGGSHKTCLVLATTGTKVCNQDAAAWCRATDELRSRNKTAAAAQTQAFCDTIESRYP